MEEETGSLREEAALPPALSSPAEVPSSPKRARRGSPEPREKRQIPQRSVSGWVIMVTNLAPEHSENALRDLCARHGKVNRVRVNKSYRTNKPRSALIEFDLAGEGESAIAALNGNDGGLKAGWAFLEEN